MKAFPVKGLIETDVVPWNPGIHIWKWQIRARVGGVIETKALEVKGPLYTIRTRDFGAAIGQNGRVISELYSAVPHRVGCRATVFR